MFLPVVDVVSIDIYRLGVGDRLFFFPAAEAIDDERDGAISREVAGRPHAIQRHVGGDHERIAFRSEAEGRFRDGGGCRAREGD